MKRLLLFVFAMTLAFAGCEKSSMDTNYPQEEQFVSGSIGDIVPGQYIVFLKDGTAGLKSVPAGYAARQDRIGIEARRIMAASSITDKELLYAYASSVRGFTVELADEELAMLSNNPDVECIWPDRYFILKKPGTEPPPPPAQVVPYGIARVGGGADYDGTASAWIIDTGIDLDHPDLNVDAARGKTFVVRTSTPDDDNGHGTHCAGIVAARNNTLGVVGVAAGAKVVPVKVLDRRGSGTVSAIIAGVDYVAASASAGDVANMSLGGGVYEPLDLAVINLGAAGVKVALAAGNESDHANFHSPARANGNNLYTVSACNSNDYWASFSNYGNPPIDFCAPGVSIYSTYKGGSFATMSGTSMAAPHVCGLLLWGTVKTDGYVIGDPDGNPDPIAHK